MRVFRTRVALGNAGFAFAALAMAAVAFAAFFGGLFAAAARKSQFRREAGDIYKLYGCLDLYKRSLSELVEQGQPEALKPPPEMGVGEFVRKRNKVHKAATEQLKEKLKWMLDPVPVTSDMPVAVQDVAGYKLVIQERKMEEQGEDQYEIEHEEKIEEPKGVFIEGCTRPGSVLCCYPGIVYMKEQIKEMPNYPNISSNNPFLMARMEGSIVDGFEYAHEDVQDYPLAAGHQIRHPPKGVLPNVVPLTYDIFKIDGFPDSLLELIPNSYHKKPSFPFYFPVPGISTVLFVATRQLKDEELFLDYRLHPQSEKPEWYKAVDEKKNSARWRNDWTKWI